MAIAAASCCPVVVVALAAVVMPFKWSKKGVYLLSANVCYRR